MIGIASIHHVSLNVRDLEQSRTFYREMLGLSEIQRPNFSFPGAWFAVGALQHLHLIVHLGRHVPRRQGHRHARQPLRRARAKLLRRRWNSCAQQGYREDSPDELKRMQLQPHATAGFPQIYILDPDRHVIEINASALDE